MAYAGQDEGRCPMCGKVAAGDARFCTQCGNALEDVTLPLDARPRDPARVPRMTGDPIVARPPPRFNASLTFGAFITALLLTVLFSSLGNLLIGLLLAPVTLALGFVWVNLARDRLEGQSGQVLRRTLRNVRGSVRVIRTATVSWSHAGRRELELRAKQRQLRHRQDELLRSLGEAVYVGNARRADVLKQTAVANADQIEQCARELHLARRDASEQVASERTSVAPTEVLDTARSVGRATAEPKPGDSTR